MNSFNWIKDLFNYLKTVRKYQKKTAFELMVERADQFHRETGKRYHVLQKSQTEMILVDNSAIDQYNRNVKKFGGKKMDINGLLRVSLYSTK